MVLLLVVHSGDNFNVTLLPGCQQVFSPCVLPLQTACLLQYLSEKLKRQAIFLGCACVCLRLCTLGSPSWHRHTSSSASAGSVSRSSRTLSRMPSHPFPQQLRVCRVARLTLVAGRIRVHRLKVLYVCLHALARIACCCCIFSLCDSSDITSSRSL